MFPCECTGPTGNGVKYGYIDSCGNLILVYDNNFINTVGYVMGSTGPTGATGIIGPTGPIGNGIDYMYLDGCCNIIAVMTDGNVIIIGTYCCPTGATGAYTGTGFFGPGFEFAQTITPENISYNQAINLLRQPETYHPTFFGSGIGTDETRIPNSTAVILGNHNDTTGPNSAEYSVAIGYYSGQILQGSGSIAIGQGAGYNIQAENSISIGKYAGNNTQNLESIAIGLAAGYTNQSGIAIGSEAGYINQSGIAIGSSAGYQYQSETGIAIGYSAGYDTQGIAGIAIGSFSGRYTQQEGAIAIGSSAGHYNQGTGSIAIGYLSGFSGIGINCICIGNGASTGTSLPDNTFATITGMATISGGSALTYNTFTGLIGVASSSERYKKDIQPFEEGYSDNVFNLEPVTFKYKDNDLPSFGLIAEKVYQYYPELAPTDKDNIPYTVNYELLSVLLLDQIKKMDEKYTIQIKELYQQIELLKKF